MVDAIPDRFLFFFVFRSPDFTQSNLRRRRTGIKLRAATIPKLRRLCQDGMLLGEPGRGAERENGTTPNAAEHATRLTRGKPRGNLANVYDGLQGPKGGRTGGRADRGVATERGAAVVCLFRTCRRGVVELGGES